MTPLAPVQANPVQTTPLFLAQSDAEDYEEDWEEEWDDEWGDEELPEETAPIELEKNPLAPLGNDLDQLIERQMADDVWQQMLDGLPCGEATVQCINQLQNEAIFSSRVLSEIDYRIEEAENRIAEAQARNQKAIALETLSPVLRYYLQTDSAQSTVDINNGQQSRPGPLERLIGDIAAPVRLFNNVLSLIGVNLFENQFGGNAQAQSRAIAIGDLQIKVAELQRARAETAQQLREKISLMVLELDTIKREFQIAQEIAKRDADRMRIIEVAYRFGEGSSETYLAQLSAMDAKKAAVFKQWSKLRSQVELLKILVLNEDEGF